MKGHAEHSPLGGRRQLATVAEMAMTTEIGNSGTPHGDGAASTRCPHGKPWAARSGPTRARVQRSMCQVHGGGAALGAGLGVQPQPSNMQRCLQRSCSIREGAACQRPAGRRPSRQGQPTPRLAVAGGRAKALAPPSRQARVTRVRSAKHDRSPRRVQRKGEPGYPRLELPAGG